MLFHALPKYEGSAVDLGMRAVKSAHKGLVENIASGNIDNFERITQNKSEEIRYTKNADFDDDVAQEYLNNLPSSDSILNTLENIDLTKFLNPFIH
jgi:hypothetical protein